MINFKTAFPFNLFLLLLSFAFVLIFCIVSSPITICYTGDSSIFMTMGRLFIDGKIPYVDFFDHKGPVIILIEAFGQIFAPFRTGVFIIEILNLFFVLIFIKKIASFRLNRKMIIVVISFFLALLSATISGGNSTEEFSLLPLFIALYITCKCYFKQCRLSKPDIFIIGLCFSFLFWLRLNNAGAICGMLFFLSVNAVIYKDYKSLKNIILYFLIAQLPLALLFTAYFCYHDGLYDLIYATFIFNFKYIQPTVIGKNFWISILVIAIVITGSVLQYKKKQDKNIFLFAFSILVFNVLTSNVGYVYKHYLILLMPSLVLGMVLGLDCIVNMKIKTAFFYISITTILAVSVFKLIKEIKSFPNYKSEYKRYADSAEDILNKIPANEMKQVYYYLVNSCFYPITGINPNYKYFILQEWQGSHDANIYNEIEETMKQSAPIWAMMEKKEKAGWDNNELRNKKFRLILDNKYVLFAENDYFILYKYKF